VAEELFDIVNEAGEITGRATREEAHRDPSLLHRVVHVIVTDRMGRILLQKRSMSKDVAPGKWDTSVGGHVDAGEEVAAAVRRELREELGLDFPPVHLYDWICRSARESELVSTWRLVHEGPFRFPPGEIDGVRFWTVEEIAAGLGRGVFSSQFEEEFRRYLKA
jgi:isopentenyldiphosphate isomerase